jgi:solute carrier family 25 protein 39/40
VISNQLGFPTHLRATAGQPTPTYASTLSTILQTITHSGPSSLYRGLGLTLLRDVPFSGLYWVVFEGFRRRIVEGRELTNQDLAIHTLEPGAGRSGNGGGSGPGDRSKLSLSETFMAGAGSGMLAALVTQPFDVLKTRKQVFQQPPPGLPALNTATGIAFKSKLKFSINTVIPSAPNSTSMSIPRHLVHIVRTEGLKALFSGVGPRTLKIAPACGMMLGCYEGVGRFFGEGEK